MSAKAPSLIAVTLRDASAWRARASPDHTATLACTRSAEETTSQPRERTSSTVPASTMDMTGSMHPAEYSIATRATPERDRKSQPRYSCQRRYCSTRTPELLN